MHSIFYFGVWSKTHGGHHLYAPGGGGVSEYSDRMPKDFPVAIHVLDTGFLPAKQPETEGRATFVHINGWTIISFWDRSGDARGKCNSAFLARGLMAFEEIVSLAREKFPSVWERFTFEVKLPETGGF